MMKLLPARLTHRHIEPIAVAITDSMQLKSVAFKVALKGAEPYVSAKSIFAVDFAANKGVAGSVLALEFGSSDIAKLSGFRVFQIVTRHILDFVDLGVRHGQALCMNNRGGATREGDTCGDCGKSFHRESYSTRKCLRKVMRGICRLSIARRNYEHAGEGRNAAVEHHTGGGVVACLMCLPVLPVGGEHVARAACSFSWLGGYYGC
jgi:hypothetical protein